MKPGDLVLIRSKQMRTGEVLKVANDGTRLALVKWNAPAGPLRTVFTFAELSPLNPPKEEK